MEFREGLTFVNDILKTIAGDDPIQIRIDLQNGKSPKQLAEEIANSDTNQTLDYLKSYATVPFAYIQRIKDSFDPNIGPGQAKKYYEEATDPVKAHQRRVDDLTNQFTKTADGLSKQKQSAEVQRLQSSTDTYLAWQNQQVEAFKKVLCKTRKN
jgi:hypothetical protein